MRVSNKNVCGRAAESAIPFCALAADPPVGQVEAMAPLPDPQQPVDKEALVLEMLKSLGPCDSRSALQACHSALQC